MAVPIFAAISPDDWDAGAWDDEVSLLKHYHIKKFILCPTHWQGYSNIVLKWKRVKFSVSGVSKLPDNKQGLYSFLVQPKVGGHPAISYLLYIGETTKQTLKERCSDYLPEAKRKKARVPIRSMIRKWPNHLWLYFAVVDDVTLIKQLEEDLIKAFIPPFNQRFTATVGKAEKLEAVLKEVFQ